MQDPDAPQPDPPEDRADLATTMRREAAARYARMAGRWSSSTRLRADSYLGAGLAAIKAFVETRLSGLAAEIAFWGIFALPWVALGLVAGLSTFQDVVGLEVVDRLEQQILTAAGRIFNETTMATTVQPLLDDLFSYGSGGLTIVAFLIALWSGSKLVSTAVQGVVLVSGHEYEGYVRTRARALVVYVVGLLGLVAALVLVFVGPGVAESVLGFGGRLLYWVLVSLIPVLLLLGLYVFSPRQRGRVRDAVPGALAATAGWLLASVGLRVFVTVSTQRNPVYAIVGTPIALLLWAYVTAYVVLLGALLNRVLIDVRESRARTTTVAAAAARVPLDGSDPA